MAEDKAIIEAVRKFECLWKIRSRVYKDLRVKENAWKSVAEEVGEGDVESCQRRWKSLRDKYVWEKKKIKKKKSGDEGPPPKSSRELFESMSLIEETIRHRPTTTNFSRPSEDSSTNNASDDAQDDEEKFTADLSTDLSDSRENETHEISLREPLSSNTSTSSKSSVCREVSVSKKKVMLGSEPGNAYMDWMM